MTTMHDKGVVIKEFTPEQRICHSLMLNVYCIKEVGIMSGKMGVLLALMEYNRSYPNPVYDDFIEDLIDDIWAHIHNKLPIGFAEGLCGIGWAVEYLIQQQIIEGTGVELCSEIDRQLMKQDPRRIDDLSFETGLEGVLYYVLIHICGALQQKQALPFDRLYLDDLHTALNAVEDMNGKQMNDFVKQYNDFYLFNKTPILPLSLKGLVGTKQLQVESIVHLPIGLNNGIAGLLLKRTIYK